MKARDSVNLKRSSSQWRSMSVTHCSAGATTSAKRPVHTAKSSNGMAAHLPAFLFGRCLTDIRSRKSKNSAWDR